MIGWLREVFSGSRSEEAGARTSEPARAPSAAGLVALVADSDEQCPLVVLREISPRAHVRSFLQACETEIHSCVVSIEAIVQTNADVSSLRDQLHRLKNAFSNSCLASQYASLPSPHSGESTSAHYAPYLPAFRKACLEALQYLKSQPEMQDGP